MGATGSGKTSVSGAFPVITAETHPVYLQFINLASGSSLPIGIGLEPYTADIELGNEFTLDGRVITLVDTPGFDDTPKCDGEILKIIAAFLATM